VVGEDCLHLVPGSMAAPETFGRGSSVGEYPPDASYYTQGGTLGFGIPVGGEWVRRIGSEFLHQGGRGLDCHFPVESSRPTLAPVPQIYKNGAPVLWGLTRPGEPSDKDV